jgi:hypothetical protein
MSEVMLDIETLSTKTNASILTIGAVKFNRHDFKVKEKFYKRITKESNEHFNRDFNQDTIDWWITQSEQAKKEIFENKDRINLSSALQELSIFCRGASKIWANGICFDIIILQSAYEACDLDVPWKFWNILDVRTIYDISNVNLTIFKRQNKLDKQHHNALADCETQLLCMKQAFENLYDRCFVVED